MLNIFDKNKKLILASKNGKLRKVQKLLQSSEFSIECLNKALLQAVLYDYPEVIQELIKIGVDVNVKIDNRGWTPLFYAVENGREKAIRCLLENGADVNTCNNKSVTPLMQSIDVELDTYNILNAHEKHCDTHPDFDYFKITRLLIDAGADINAKDEDGVGVVEIADLYNNSLAIKLLKEYGAVAVPKWNQTKNQNDTKHSVEEKVNIHDVIKKLRQLNHPVPIPLRLPTIEEINLMEQKLGIHFHPDYREYLLRASDVVYPTLEPATIANPKSHTYLPKIIESARQCGVSGDLLPICEDNGNFYCMNQEGQVLYCPHDGWSDEKWDDLATWIQDVWIDRN